MDIINEFKMTFMAESRNEGFSRAVTAAFLTQLDPSVSELTDVKTAVSEAVTNSIVHGYRNTWYRNTWCRDTRCRDKRGKIELSAKIDSGNTVYIKIKDSGCGIEDIKQAMEPLYTSAPEEERAGLGFAVMESCMDKVRVTSRAGKGTTVTMKRKIGDGQQQ